MRAAVAATVSLVVVLAGIPAARAVQARGRPGPATLQPGVAAAREDRWNEEREAFARAGSVSRHLGGPHQPRGAEARTGRPGRRRRATTASDPAGRIRRRRTQPLFARPPGRAPCPRGPDPLHSAARYGPGRHGRRRDRWRDDLVGSPRAGTARPPTSRRNTLVSGQAIGRRAVPCFVLRRGRRVARHPRYRRRSTHRCRPRTRRRSTRRRERISRPPRPPNPRSGRPVARVGNLLGCG